MSANQNTFRDTEYDYLEFHPREIARLSGLDLEVGLCYFVLEARESDEFMRELKVDLVVPEQFEFDRDV
jgi:hypothetical protein